LMRNVILVVIGLAVTNGIGVKNYGLVVGNGQDTFEIKHTILYVDDRFGPP
jgi:hypothetical protein